MRVCAGMPARLIVCARSTPLVVQVYCAYEGERAVDPGYQRSAFESRSFGAHMDVQRLLAKQVRMERQEKAAIAATSFDSFAAHAFQAYIQSALDFSIKRCGILYGRLEGDIVLVDAIYEPEQQGKTERMAWVTDSAQARPQTPFLRRLAVLAVAQCLLATAMGIRGEQASAQVADQAGLRDSVSCVLARTSPNTQSHVIGRLSPCRPRPRTSWPACLASKRLASFSIRARARRSTS